MIYRRALQIASRCVILSEKMNMSGRVFCYEEMGIYNLFSELADKKVMQEFIRAIRWELLLSMTGIIILSFWKH